MEARTTSLRTLSILVLIGLSCAEFVCQKNEDYTKPVCYKESCIKGIQKQVKEELTAALSYLHIAAILDHESLNRPGLAKFMYAASSEERQHAIMMLDYLNHRGIPNEEGVAFEVNQVPEDVIGYRDAMLHVLNLEITVTDSIHKIIAECVDDFHAADKFTQPIMAEQHESIRQLQGMIKEFDNLAQGTTDPHALSLAEYLLDQKLLNGEL